MMVAAENPVQRIKRPSTGSGRLLNLLDASGKRFTYDAVYGENRRKQPVNVARSEDWELWPAERQQLVVTARDVARNYSIAASMIRLHLDYVSTFSFQARTPDEDLNKRIERLVEAWGRPENWDSAGRHGRRRMIRLAERCRVVDGDCFIQRLSDGKVNAIEGDRVRMPYGGIPPQDIPEGYTAADFVHGVLASSTGRAVAYCVCRRTRPGGGFLYDRLVPARYLEHLAYWDRIDQLRGVSPMASALNSLRDVYEGFDYMLAKLKVAQLFALAIIRKESEQIAEVTPPGEDAEAAEEAEKGYEVDFGKGPQVLDMDPGDDAHFLESTHPGTESQQFCKLVIWTALKCLDIPYSFFDESFTTFGGQRQAILQYEGAADQKREDIREVLDRLTRWRLGLWLLDGELVLPAKMGIEDIAWEWVSRGVPWIDPLKEVNADVTAIGAALTSRTRACRGRGEDFYQIADEISRENEYLKSKGLPVNLDPGHVQITEVTNAAH